MNDLNKQKTLVVTTPYFPPYGGGLERYALEISSRLASPDYNYKVIVITSGERCGKDSVERVGDLKVYRLSYKLKVSNTPFSFRWFGKIRKILKNEKPDLINIHMPVPGIGDVANLVSRGIPKIVTYHSGTISKGKSLLGLVSCLYEVVFLKVLLDNAKSIICSSDFIRFGFLKKYEYKSITITPGVNSDVFKPDPSKKTSYPSILFVAGLNKTEQYKGLQTLIDTMVEVKKIIPDIVLNVVGDGDMREEYERRVKDLGLENSIKFFGRLTGDRLVEKYQRNHIFISASSNESFSMVILEAMASGLPVIAINSGSVNQIIDDGQNGFILSSQNKGMIEDKILELIRNKELIVRFAENAKHKAKIDFGWPSRVYQTNTLFSKFFNKSSNTNMTDSIFTKGLSDLSVVILTYNSQNTISHTLDSLLRQKNKNFDIVIVDDNSSDDTLKIINEYKIKHNLNINIFINGTNNLSIGRNIGLKESKTNFIAFLDSDDLADDNWTNTVINTFKNDSEIGIISGPLIFSSSTLVGEAISTNDSAIREIFGRGSILFCTANSAFNKSSLKGNYFFDEDFIYSEDLELVSRVSKYNKWVYVPEMKVYYSARNTFKSYAFQMYLYGKWKMYYEFLTKEYRLIDFIPSGIIIISLFFSLMFRSFVPLLILPIFSFLESLFIFILKRPGLKVSSLLFPAWFIKNLFWSIGIFNGIFILFIDKNFRRKLNTKRII